MITDEAKRVKAQAYAEYVREIVQRKHNLEARIAHQREELELSGVAYGERVAVSPSMDAIPDGVAGLADMIAEYSADLNEYVRVVYEFENAIGRLWPQYECVLEHRYINGEHRDQIAELMSYTERHIYNIERLALIGLYDVMPACWRT